MLPPTLSWLDVQCVQNILKLSEQDESINVLDLALKFATEPGDNGLSDMIRASVTYSRSNSSSIETKKRSLIIKIEPTANIEVVTGLGVFEREIQMMKTTLVKINELLGKDESRLSPHVFYTDNGKPAFIVMEDMAELGYRMADRITGFDLEHSIAAMRRLAKLHGTSVAVWEKDPKVVESYTKSVFHKDNPEQVKKFFRDSIKAFSREVLNWSELGDSAKSYSDKFLKLSDVCYEKAIECAQSKITDFNVLNHGDCWVNNILFKYDNEGKIINNIFVDFQLSWWYSPAADLISLTNTSLSEEVEVHYKDTLLEEYLNTLTQTMTTLDCSTKAPNMEALKQILREHEFWEIMYACAYLPVMITPKNNTVALDELFDQYDEYVSAVYKGKGYRRRMVRRLPVWDASGVLDV